MIVRYLVILSRVVHCGSELGALVPYTTNAH